MYPRHLMPVREIDGLFCDALLVEGGDLRFLSLWGLDSQVREFQGRLSVPVRDPQRLHQFAVGDTVVQAVATDYWQQFTGRVRTRLFGELVHVWIFDGRTTVPDRANGRALLLEQGGGHVDDERLWSMTREVCPYPMLEHWREPVLEAFRRLGWVSTLDGVGVTGTWIALGPQDRVQACLQRLIRAGVLTLRPEMERAALPDLEDLLRDDVEEAGQDPWAGAPIVHAYSRAQAIEDGYLVDVSEVAREAGFTVPVALTRAVWEGWVAWDEHDTQAQVYQDEAGRLWDVVYMAHFAAKAQRADQEVCAVQLWRVPRDGRATEAELTELKMVIGPGDAGEPVITIMEPGED